MNVSIVGGVSVSIAPTAVSIVACISVIVVVVVVVVAVVERSCGDWEDLGRSCESLD